MANRLIIPHQLTHVLLYGEMDWIEREMPMIVVPVREVCVQLRTRPVQIQEALEWLRLNGVLSTYTWSHTYFTVSVNMPVGVKYKVVKEVELA